MGKGDKRTKRGKIHIGSTGVKRQKKKSAKKVSVKKVVAKEIVAVEEPKKAAAPKKAK
jgi:ribosomal small subunit protein bTHX